MHKLAVVGSRDFTDPSRVKRWLTNYLTGYQVIHVVTGDAPRGADHEAVEWAKATKMPYTVYPANWYPGKHGELDRGAGFKRNAYIAQDADNMVCFWDGMSHGTAHDIHLWYMKAGDQPLVVNEHMQAVIVPHQDVIDLLGISRRK